MGRADHEVGTRQMGRRPRRIRQLARVGRTRSHELSEAAPGWSRWNYSAGRQRPSRDSTQYATHGMGAKDPKGRRNRHQPKQLKIISDPTNTNTNKDFETKLLSLCPLCQLPCALCGNAFAFD